MQNHDSQPLTATLDDRLTETALACAHGAQALQSLDSGDWGWVDALTDELDAEEDRAGRRADSRAELESPGGANHAGAGNITDTSGFDVSLPD